MLSAYTIKTSCAHLLNHYTGSSLFRNKQDDEGNTGQSKRVILLRHFRAFRSNYLTNSGRCPAKFRRNFGGFHVSAFQAKITYKKAAKHASLGYYPSHNPYSQYASDKRNMLFRKRLHVTIPLACNRRGPGAPQPQGSPAQPGHQGSAAQRFGRGPNPVRGRPQCRGDAGSWR